MLSLRTLSDLHFQHLPQFSRSFWLLVVSGFLCSIGMFKSEEGCSVLPNTCQWSDLTPIGSLI